MPVPLAPDPAVVFPKVWPAGSAGIAGESKEECATSLFSWRLIPTSYPGTLLHTEGMNYEYILGGNVEAMFGCGVGHFSFSNFMTPETASRARIRMSTRYLLWHTFNVLQTAYHVYSV